MLTDMTHKYATPEYMRRASVVKNEKIEQSLFDNFGYVYISERAPYGQYGYGIFKDGEVLCADSPSYGHRVPLAFADKDEAEAVAKSVGGVADYVRRFGVNWSKYVGPARFNNRGTVVIQKR